MDPMEPPRFQINKKIPRAAPSPPAPVLHSPPRRVSVKQQRDWKVPPCVSHWKNAKGNTRRRTHVHTCTYTCTHVHASIHMYMHLHMCTCTLVNMCTHVQTRVHTHKHVVVLSFSIRLHDTSGQTARCRRSWSSTGARERKLCQARGGSIHSR